MDIDKGYSYLLQVCDFMNSIIYVERKEYIRKTRNKGIREDKSESETEIIILIPNKARFIVYGHAAY